MFDRKYTHCFFFFLSRSIHIVIVNEATNFPRQETLGTKNLNITTTDVGQSGIGTSLYHEDLGVSMASLFRAWVGLSSSIYIYIYIWILLMYALKAHNSKPILKKVYRELKKF